MQVSTVQVSTALRACGPAHRCVCDQLISITWQDSSLYLNPHIPGLIVQHLAPQPRGRGVEGYSSRWRGPPNNRTPSFAVPWGRAPILHHACGSYEGAPGAVVGAAPVNDHLTVPRSLTGFVAAPALVAGAPPDPVWSPRPGGFVTVARGGWELTPGDGVDPEILGDLGVLNRC